LISRSGARSLPPAAEDSDRPVLFNSADFFVLLALVWVGCRLLPARARTLLLLAASWLFYAWWDPRFLSLLWLTTGVDYVAALRIEAARARGDARAARRWFGLSLCTSLGMLGFFKYFDFFAESTAGALGALGLSVSPFTLQIVLPAGISFYTFQTLAYVIDVYRGQIAAERNAVDFALFVAFFPQLMAGPIERAASLLPQLERLRAPRLEDLAAGGWLVFWGLFKKVFVADNLAPYTHWAVAEGGAGSAADVWIALFAFSMQFYCDFSGYSDMAVGLGRFFGVRLEPNFHLPFFAQSPTELWNRWHRTLASWFRDYVYGPLTARWSAPRGRALAALLTMSLVGLWHGARWTYVAWGAAWGLTLVLHRLARAPLARLSAASPRLAPWLSLGGVLLTFHLWMVIGAFFICERIEHAFFMQRVLFTGFDSGPTSARDALTVLYYCAPLLAVQAAQLASGRMEVLQGARAPLRFAVYALLAGLLLVMGAESDEAFFYYAF
jgi:D-alanyl-lipoteichoic acid acyltransferase DltB (MBOAT superfamily)